MSPVSVEVTFRILSDGRVLWEQTLALPRSGAESIIAEEPEGTAEMDERVLPLSTSVVVPGLFVPAPA